MKPILLTVLLLAAVLLPLAARNLHAATPAPTTAVTVRAADHSVTLQNGLLRIDYDLNRGTYSAASLADPAAYLGGAALRIDALASTDPGLTHTWEVAPVRDRLGRGSALTVRSAGPGRPTLVLTLTLYEGQGLLALAGGVVRGAGAELRIHEIHPLSGATIFPALGPRTGWRILNGEAGGGTSQVTDKTTLESPNNLLLTFNAGGRRHSLVLGGLTYHEWGKYARVGAASNRVAELSALAPPGMRLAGYLDCGAPATPPLPGVRFTVTQGQPYAFNTQPAAAVAPALADVLFDEREVTMESRGLDPGKDYLLGLSWWDYDHATGRVESVRVWGGDGQPHVLLAQHTLPDFRVHGQGPEVLALKVPADAYATGRLKIGVLNHGKINAVVSEAWLWEAPRGGAPAAWGPRPAPAPAAAAPERDVAIDLYAADPAGRLLDTPGEYRPDDRFYVDFTTPDPFEALEKYGLSVRAAQDAHPNLYDFPTVCGWYVMMKEYGGGPDINHSAGMVDEMQTIARSGFLKYSRAAVRLVPDTYADNNEQGWWDEAHWQQYGHYRAPYETTAKWAGAVAALGGIPETYFQTGFISLDYARAHPGHMLFNDISGIANAQGHRNNAASYDYTDPGFRAHLAEDWAGLRRGGVRGVMFDYPETGWHPGGGFEDKHATTAAAYRAIFELAKTGLGPDSFIHERNIAGQPFLDLTAGVVDSQRVWGDSDLPLPEMMARCGLRWYKNRVLFTYDMDSKNFFKTLPPNRDGERQMLTLCTLLGGRLLLANSFRKLTPEQIHDLSRVYPIYPGTKSPRPLDAFQGGRFPRVYDLEIEPGWHQLAFWNPDAKNGATVNAALSAPGAEGGLGLNAGKSYFVYDFWNDRLIGKLPGRQILEQTLRPGEARMMSIHEAAGHPQVIATDRHVLQGAVDLVQTGWSEAGRRLTGQSRVIGGEPYRVIIASGGLTPRAAAAGAARAAIRVTDEKEGLAVLEITSKDNALLDWSVEFE